jgi:GNAT superfamily N-acetyltransferase
MNTSAPERQPGSSHAARDPIDLRDVARLEQRQIAVGVSEITATWRPCSGGTAAMNTPGLWINAIFGAGMDTPVDEAEIHDIVKWYEEAGIEPRVKACPYAHESFHALLMRMGFVVKAYESVLFREIDASTHVEPVYPMPGGIRIEVVDRTNEAQITEFALASMAGFMPEVATPQASHVEQTKAMVRHARTVSLVARLADGTVAGSGAVEVTGEVCALFALSVLPAHRRKGIQQALIAWRLNHAAAHGARLATIGSKPGIATERNVRRMGFQVAYTQPVLVRPGPGLVPVAGA